MDGGRPAPVLRLGRWWRPPGMPGAVACAVASSSSVSRCQETGAFVWGDRRALSRDAATWTIERLLDGSWVHEASHPSDDGPSAASVLRGQRSLAIRSVPSWGQVQRAMLRALVADPVAIASSLLGRQDVARREALRFLETIGLIGSSHVAEGVAPRGAPEPVMAFAASNPKARLLFWLNPDHADEARALVEGWDAEVARRDADDGERRERRLSRLRSTLRDAFPNMPEDARSALDEDRLAEVRLTDATALRDFLVDERTARMAAQIAGSAEADALAGPVGGRPLRAHERRALLAGEARRRAEDEVDGWRPRLQAALPGLS